MGDHLAQMIGERVRFYRTASRRTKAVVAGLGGITPDYLYQIERGQKVPTVAVLTQLAEVLRVSVGELLDGQPERETGRVKAAAGEAIYRALTSPIATDGASLDLPKLRQRVNDAWYTWQTSPHRYSQLVGPVACSRRVQVVRQCSNSAFSSSRVAVGLRCRRHATT